MSWGWKRAVLGVLIAAGMATGVARNSMSGEGEPAGDLRARAQRIAHDTILVDTHIDVPYRLNESYADVSTATSGGDFDYPRAVAGGLDVVFFSIFIPAELEETGGAGALAERLIDMVDDLIAKHPDKFAPARSVAEVRRNFAAGKISLAMGMENGAPIAGDLAKLRHFFDRGIRYITLAHSKSNHIADSSYDPERRWHGLSDFGRKLVAAMNEMGMMIDVSHISDEAFYQVIALSKTPVIASHSSARHFTPGWERNMDDDMIRALGKNGGVIQVNFGSGFVNAKARAADQAERDARQAYFADSGVEETPAAREAFSKRWRAEHPYPYAGLDDVLDVIDHIVKLVGIDHVGLGSDFDGVGDSLPEGLKDVSAYPNLIAGLLRRGYSEEDIRKILSGNILRVWSEVEAYAARVSGEATSAPATHGK